MTKLSEYLKVAEAAKYLGVSQTTLRKWADAGVVPVRIMPVGRFRLFRQEDLDRFLRETEKPSVRNSRPR